MFLLKWYREWKQIRSEFFQPPVCASCEALKETVNSLQYQNGQLLAALTHKPEIVQPVIDPNLKPMMPRRVPWGVKRQMLESQDKAQHDALLKKKQQEMNPPVQSVAATTLEELEREVGVVEEDAERETNAS